MQTDTRLKASLMAVALAAALGTTACSKSSEPNPGQMDNEQAEQAPKESAGIGEAIGDTAITAKVKGKLSSDSRTNSANIDVETNNGVVTLTGSVGAADTKSVAEELARNVEGVTGVDNKIAAPSAGEELGDSLENAADRAGDAVSDAAITTKVKTQLLADDMTDGLDIDVDTANGVVTLVGNVKTQAEADRAKQIAQTVDGVRSVKTDGLKVTQ